MSSTVESSPPADFQWDPVYLHARREAVFILLVWGLAACWCIPYCFMYGFGPVNENEPLKLVLGMPSWIFWGVALPWLTADVITLVFCLFIMKDDDLGESDPEGEPIHVAHDREAAQ